MRSPGTNCNNETAQALRMVGIDTEQIHINQFIDRERMLSEFSIVVIPGGFSYGDYIAAGSILANQLLSQLKAQLETFTEAGNLLVGICNGFQVLVKSGLLPGEGLHVTLTHNDSGNFECRWITLIDRQGHVMHAPVAHGEGKFIATDETLDMLEQNKQIIYRYSDSTFPANPNGSLRNIAGISNRQGNIIGLMPHPERCLTQENYPTGHTPSAEGRLQFFKMIAERARR